MTDSNHETDFHTSGHQVAVMADLDPVYWDEIVTAFGPPAEAIDVCVDRMATEVRGEDPYRAVKAIHDTLAADPDTHPVPPDQGEVFIVAYLLEKRGIIEPIDEFPSIVDRRPDDDRLYELFWDPERTMWWLAVRLGVHWSLVRYWLYEADVPLRERNFPDDTLKELRENQNN